MLASGILNVSLLTFQLLRRRIHDAVLDEAPADGFTAPERVLPSCPGGDYKIIMPRTDFTILVIDFCDWSL